MVTKPLGDRERDIFMKVKREGKWEQKGDRGLDRNMYAPRYSRGSDGNVMLKNKTRLIEKENSGKERKNASL